jgi:hypothetical protein
MEVDMPRRALFATFLMFALLLALSSQHLLAQIPAARNDTLIRLKSVTFDPGAGEPNIAQSLRSAVQSGLGTYLVQFNGPVQEAWKAGAERAGARLFGYVPEHAFIAQMDASAVAPVRALPFVRWVGPYHPAYRIDSALAHLQDSGRVTVEIQTLPNTSLDALSKAIAGWDGTVADATAGAIAGYVRATLPASRLGDLAAQEGVLWVAPYAPPQLFNNIGGGQIMRANEVRQSLGLFGAGQIVAVADTGLDVGDTTKIHADFQGRVIKSYCLGRPDPCDWSDPDAHGTHVAGSVLGSGKASGSNPTDHQYPTTSFAGVAPEAKLVMQSIGDANDGLNGIPNDEGDLMRQAYQDGARIHTNSWGGPTGGTQQRPEYGGYATNSQQIDQAAWEHKDMLILFAAGNQGTDADGDGVIDPDSIGQPGTAKNVVTVGASENLRNTGGYNPGGDCGSWGECWPNDFATAPLGNDTPSNNANGMAAFSSRGPTDDGRIKPDIVAPGTNILSTRSHSPNAGTGWGAYDANYIFEGGTSMATPLTAGAGAVVREWLTRIRSMPNPSGALMKGVLINGAADMSPGQYGTGATQEIPTQRPNNVEGWGRVDLREALDPPAPRAIWLVDDTTGTNTGGTVTYKLDVSAAQAREASALASSIRTDHAKTRRLAGTNDISLQGTSQLVQNPGFEGTTFVPWETFHNTTLDTTVKYSGAQSAHMGGTNGANDQVFQALSVPSDASDVSIDFWYRFATTETSLFSDYFCYGLYDTTGQITYVENCGDFGQLGSQDWTRETYTLTSSERASVAGKSVLLAFYVQNDFFSLPSEAWVDDTALNVTTPGGSPTATPAGSPTATPTPTPPSGAGGPLRVTLAWTDYPGEPAAARALVNDLDLEVIGPDGTHYTGNQGLYTSGQCLRDSKWDGCNNVEGIIIPNATAGSYTITVHGIQVAQGGRQPFALVATGNGLKQADGPRLQKAAFVPLLLRSGGKVIQVLDSSPTPTP